MKLSQKQTCDGCRAAGRNPLTSLPKCALGYNNVGPTIKSFAWARAVPQEPCPKPRTYKEWFTAQVESKKK